MLSELEVTTWVFRSVSARASVFCWIGVPISDHCKQFAPRQSKENAETRNKNPTPWRDKKGENKTRFSPPPPKKKKTHTHTHTETRFCPLKRLVLNSPKSGSAAARASPGFGEALRGEQSALRSAQEAQVQVELQAGSGSRWRSQVQKGSKIWGWVKFKQDMWAGSKSKQETALWLHLPGFPKRVPVF